MRQRVRTPESTQRGVQMTKGGGTVRWWADGTIRRGALVLVGVTVLALVVGAPWRAERGERAVEIGDGLLETVALGGEIRRGGQDIGRMDRETAGCVGHGCPPAPV